MPQHEEYAVSKGRREVMANVAGAAVLGLGLSATKARADEEEEPGIQGEAEAAPGPPNR